MSFAEFASIAANVVTAAGVVGLYFAYRQLKLSLLVQREATAMGIWKDYLQLALANPELAEPSIYTTSGHDPKVFARYEWFVSGVLIACEQMLQLYSQDAAWQEIVRAQLRYHEAYLSREEFVRAHYSLELQKLMPPARPILPRGSGS